MTIAYSGFQLKVMVAMVSSKADAKFISFETFLDLKIALDLNDFTYH